MNGQWIHRLGVRCAVLSTAVLTACADESPAGFDRYQGLLARMPFGAEVPPERVAAVPVATPASSLSRNLKISALTRVEPAGNCRVGLQDLASRKNYFLAVGESEDGITVVQADYDGDKALIRRGAEELWIGMTRADLGGPNLSATLAAMPGTVPAQALASVVGPTVSVPVNTPGREGKRLVVSRAAAMRRNLMRAAANREPTREELSQYAEDVHNALSVSDGSGSP